MGQRKRGREDPSSRHCAWTGTGPAVKRGVKGLPPLRMPMGTHAKPLANGLGRGRRGVHPCTPCGAVTAAMHAAPQVAAHRSWSRVRATTLEAVSLEALSPLWVPLSGWWFVRYELFLLSAGWQLAWSRIAAAPSATQPFGPGQRTAG